METLQAMAFTVPTRDEVTPNNQAIFDDLQKKLGFVPNLYAYYAKNETALADYLTKQHRKSTLRAREKEVINLVASQINECHYCLAAHTTLGKLNGFSDEEMIEIRKGTAMFDEKLDALARFTASVVENRGRATQESKAQFFAAGYNESNMIDVVMTIGDKLTSNFLHNLTGLEIDFPLAEKL